MLETPARPFQGDKESACEANVLSRYRRESRVDLKRLKPEQIQIPRLPPLPVLAPLDPSVITSLLQDPSEPDLPTNFPNATAPSSTAAPYIHTASSTEPTGPDQRSFIFRSKWHERTFICLLMLSQTMIEYFLSGFAVILPQLIDDFRIPEEMSTWPATVFSLTLAGFLFLFGRLADTFGGYPVFLGGCVWFLGTSLITGFCQTSATLIVLRALQGLGPAALLPAASKLLYAIYPEGQRRTSMVGLYTAGAPIGIFVGMLVAGATVEYLRWQWYFWFGSVCLFLMSILTWFIIPKTSPQSRQYLRWTDWIGSLLIIIGLMLVIFGISYNLGQDSGWRLALRVSTLLSGVLLLVASALIGRRTERPLIPMPQGHCADMVVITLVQLFSYGSFGIFMFYGALCFQNTWTVSPLHVAIWYLPFVATSVMIGLASRQLLHRIRGCNLLVISSCGSVISAGLLGFVGKERNHWARIVPVMICASLGLDITYDVSSVHIAEWFESHNHGFVGAWISSLLNISVALFLGVTGEIMKATAASTGAKDYRPAFWLQFGSSLLGLFLSLFSRIPKAASVES